MKESLILLAIIGFISVSECRRNKIRPGTRCTTPDGKWGICYHLRDCMSQLELVIHNKTNPAVLEFLKKSICDLDGREPIVCCPDTVQSMPINGRMESPQNDPYPRMLSPPNCGISTAVHSRIQGGSPASLGAWPWMAALGYVDKIVWNQFKGYFCGGSLISNRHVITAAHCLHQPNSNLHFVRLGELNLDGSVNDGASPINHRVQRSLAHPRYHSRRQVNDIAILYLHPEVQFNKFISPICIPKGERMRRRSFEGIIPFVAGWGSQWFRGPASDQLLEVQVPVVTTQECNASYFKLGNPITYNDICAGFIQGGKDACPGDSGGPLMFASKRAYYLIGIAYKGHRCAEPGYPGLYTRTTEYLDWIHDNLL